MKIESLKISHFPMTRSARVVWAAYEMADCPVEIDAVDLYRGAQHSPDYLGRNPNHNVPTLEIRWDDGSRQTMIESVAMVTFLADAFPAAKLAPLPGATRERADYLQALHFCGTQIDMMLWQVRIHEHILPDSERDARTIQRYREKFKSEAEPQLASRLANRAYMCGDEFTAADCVAGQTIFWARGYGLCQDDLFRRYVSRVAKRPAFARAFSDAGSFQLEAPGRNHPSSRFNG